jgi:hypothetical protein
MKVTKHDLSTYKQDHNFYQPFSLLSTVKSFDLQAIRERYLKTRAKKSNRTGSVERRKVSIGGIVHLGIEKGKLSYSNILAKLPEPRGIHCVGDIMALSSENKAFVIQNDTIHTIQNEWFSYIHTVQINKNDQSKLLISSSGFDCIFEYDYLKNEQTFEWFAWENGFAHGKDPETGKKVFLTRDKAQAEKYNKERVPHIFITDPVNNPLPTAKRAAFINSVVYDTEPERLLATFFHEGAVFAIDRISGKAEKVLDNLKNPHGGQSLGQQFMGTSTGSGELVIGNENEQNRYDFRNLPGKPVFLSEMEWIQNSIIRDENIISIDSNRNTFVIFNPEKKLIDFIPYDNNWAVQDIAITDVSKEQAEVIKSLNRAF